MGQAPGLLGMARPWVRGLVQGRVFRLLPLALGPVPSSRALVLAVVRAWDWDQVRERGWQQQPGRGEKRAAQLAAHSGLLRRIVHKNRKNTVQQAFVSLPVCFSRLRESSSTDNKLRQSRVV